MKSLRITSALLLATAVSVSSGCGWVGNIRAKYEVNEGAKFYKEGKFKEAEDHFAAALEHDPAQENAPLFRARAIQRQYRQGLESPENNAKAERAIQAYEELLKKDPNNDEAYNAIVQLYGVTKQDEKQLQYVQATANSQQASGTKRAIANAFLAGKKWRCSYDLTEQPESKQTIQKGDKTVIEYKKPADENTYNQARQCSTEGLELANQAVSLDPNSVPAWAVKANLLLEMSKLSQMEGNLQAREDFDRQYREAIEKNRQLSEIARQKKEEEKKRKEQDKKAKNS